MNSSTALSSTEWHQQQLALWQQQQLLKGFHQLIPLLNEISKGERFNDLVQSITSALGSTSAILWGHELEGWTIKAYHGIEESSLKNTETAAQTHSFDAILKEGDIKIEQIGNNYTDHRVLVNTVAYYIVSIPINDKAFLQLAVASPINEFQKEWLEQVWMLLKHSNTKKAIANSNGQNSLFDEREKELEEKQAVLQKEFAELQNAQVYQQQLKEAESKISELQRQIESTPKNDTGAGSPWESQLENAFRIISNLEGRLEDAINKKEQEGQAVNERWQKKLEEAENTIAHLEIRLSEQPSPAEDTSGLEHLKDQVHALEQKLKEQQQVAEANLSEKQQATHDIELLRNEYNELQQEKAEWLNLQKHLQSQYNENEAKLKLIIQQLKESEAQLTTTLTQQSTLLEQERRAYAQSEPKYKEEIASLNSKLEEYHSKLTSHGISGNAMTHALEELTVTFNELKQKEEEHLREIENLNEQLKQSQHTIDSLQSQLAQQHESIEEKDRQISELAATQHQMQETIEGAKKVEIEAIELKREREEQEMTIRSLAEQLETLERGFQEQEAVLKEQYGIQEELQKKAKQIEDLEQAMQQQASEMQLLEEHSQERNRLMQTCNEYQGTIDDLQREAITQSEENHQLQKQLENTKQEWYSHHEKAQKELLISEHTLKEMQQQLQNTQQECHRYQEELKSYDIKLQEFNEFESKINAANRLIREQASQLEQATFTIDEFKRKYEVY